MALYRVTLADGSQYQIEGPENASKQALRYAAEKFARDEELREAEAKVKALSERPAAPADTTLGGSAKELFKGLIPGAVGLGESAAVGLSALLPKAQEESARETIKQLATSAKEPFAAAPGYEESIARKLSEGLGSTLPFFALGPLGWAGRLIGGGLGVSAGAGEARTKAEAAGATEGERATATALGIGPGLLDVVAPGLGHGINNIVLRALARGGVEGATEAAQNVAQNLIARGVYNPNQDVLAGTAEEGAYGAGVGALSSLIIDATLGRRARRAGAPTPAPAAAPAAPGAPVSPEVSGIVSPSVEFPQGELFARDLSLARRQQAAQAAARPEFELTSPEAPQGEQLELPLEATAPAAPQQRDLIDELEAQQTKELIDQDETNQILSLFEQDAQREQQAQAQRDRLKFESDLAETDARRMEADRKQTENHRLEILRTIIEEPSVKNIQATFGDALKIAGYTDTNFTPREREMIQRASDVRAAQPVGAEVEPSAPAQLGTMEAAIPERREARPPEQLGIPGVGKREAPAAPEMAEPAAPKFSTVLTADVLNSTGLPPQSETYKQLLNKDMANPAQQEQIRDALVNVRTNPQIDANTKGAVERVAMQAFGALSTQSEMFGPRGGVISPAKEAPRDTGRTVPTGVGVGVPSAGPSAAPGRVQPATTTATATAAVTPPGLVPNQQPPGQAVIGKAGAPAPLTPPAAAPVAAAPTAAAPRPKLRTIEEDGIAGYMQVAKGNKDKALDYLAHDMALAMYPEKNVAKELNAITLDLQSNKISNPKFGKPDTYAPYTGGKFAKGFFDSLNTQDYKTLVSKLQNIFADYARTDLRMANMATAQEVERARSEVSESDQTKYGLSLEAPILGAQLHPAVRQELEAGNLVNAVRIMARMSDGRTGAVATKLADSLGTTKVVLSADVKNEAGKPVAGRYDPQTDTVYLSTDLGMSGHVLLHEVTHATTSHVLSNLSHPVTKQLTRLYEEARPYLDTAYGARSLEEFVAEAFSNPQFQEQLSLITAKGKPVTMWQRFVNTVQNYVRHMLGMSTKPIETALDATDRLVTDIISPAPQYRGAGSLYSASATGESAHALDVYGAHAMGVPTLTQERIYKIREFLTTTPKSKAAEGIRMSLPLNALVDVAKKEIPMAAQIGTVVDERAGAENKRNQLIEPIVKRTSEWASANPQKLDNLNSVVYNSTLYQVDPSNPRENYKGKTDASGNSLEAVWDMLAPKWKALGEDGRSVYKQMRDTYAALHKEIERVLFARIDAAFGENKDAAKKVKEDIYKRLFESGKIEPYFPLTRTGKYWISYTANGEFYVEAYETSAMREDAIKALKGSSDVDAASIQKFANASQINYRNAPSTSFVNNILRTLEANKKGASPEAKERIDEATQEVMNLFLNLLPETSFAQGFRHRKNTLGFNQDAIRALRSKTYNLSRQLANIEYGAKLEAIRTDMQDHVRANGSKESAVAYMDELNKRIDFAISPNVAPWSKAMTSVGFAWTLGFNISSAVVNLAQVPVVVMPYLGGRYGYGATTNAIGQASKLFLGSGTSREAKMLVPVRDDKGNEVEKSMTVRAAPSMDNYDFSDPNLSPEVKRLATLARIAGARGQLNRSLSYDVLEVDAQESLTSKINKYSGFVFHHGERMNRQVALIAAYNLELDRLNKPDAKLEDGSLASNLTDAQKEEYAANHAIYLTELTNGGTSAASAPRIAQGNLGRVLFMYKRYGVSMYYMLCKTMRDAVAHEDADVRNAAKKQFAGIFGSAALFAGAQGVPFIGILGMLYNMFAGDDEDDFDTAMRKKMPEWAYSGMINAVTGADVASRIGLSDLLFRDTTVKDQQSLVMRMAEMMGGPVAGIASRVERGVNLINEGHVRRGVEQMLPSAISSLSKAERFAREGALTMRGDPIQEEFGVGQVLGQVFGLSPASYTRQLEINTSTKKIDRAAGQERTKLLRNYYVALRQGDTDEAQQVVKKMADFNNRHPGARITPDTIRSSLAQHIKTSKEMTSGILISKNMRAELMQHRAAFEPTAQEEEE